MTLRDRYLFFFITEYNQKVHCTYQADRSKPDNFSFLIFFCLTSDSRFREAFFIIQSMAFWLGLNFIRREIRERKGTFYRPKRKEKAQFPARDWTIQSVVRIIESRVKEVFFTVLLDKLETKFFFQHFL